MKMEGRLIHFRQSVSHVPGPLSDQTKANLKASHNNSRLVECVIFNESYLSRTFSFVGNPASCLVIWHVDNIILLLTAKISRQLNLA